MPEIPSDHWLFTPNAAGSQSDDAVLALIAEHERLWQLETKEATAAANTLHEQLCETKPATLAGAIAQLEFAAKYDDPDLAKTVAAGLREIAAGPAIEKSNDERSDGALFELIAEYRRLWRWANSGVYTGNEEENETELARRCDEVRAALDKIDAIRPQTLPGVLATFDLASEVENHEHWPEEAIEGLRKIIRSGAQADEAVATTETAAPISFDPWPPDVIGNIREQMLSPETWEDFRGTLLMALLTIGKSKPELVEATRKLAVENLEALRTFADLLVDAEARLRGLADMVAGASARHLIAMSAFVEGGEARP